MKREIQLFPDIRLVYGTIPDIADKNILEISYCMKGVCEYRINSGYYYLTNKSCMILRHDTKAEFQYLLTRAAKVQILLIYWICRL